MSNSRIRSFIVQYGCWLPSMILIGYSIYQSVSVGGNDFSNSYFAADFFLQGKFDLGIFDPYTFNRRIYDAGYRNLFLNYNPNPPSTAVFFMPFALMPLDVSKLLFNILSSGFFLLSVYRFCKHCQINTSVIALLLPVIFFIPIQNQILFGQSYFLVFILIVEGYVAYQSRKPIQASILWTASIFLKVFPIILFLFLILRKDWRQVFYFGGLCIVILLGCVVVQGMEVWKEYFLTVLPRSNKGEIQSAYLVSYQSASMLFKYLFVRDEVTNVNPFVDSIFLFKYSVIVFKALVLGICSVIALQRKNVLSFAVVLFCGILISPYGSTYSNLLLLVLLIAIRCELDEKVFWISAACILVIGNLPVSLFEHLPVLLRFPRLIFMCILLIYILRKSKVRFDIKVSVFYLILLGVPSIVDRDDTHDQSKPLLSQANHNLIFSYGARNDSIFYHYWYQGPEIFYTDIRATSLNEENIFIRNNQVFYKNKQVTNSADTKAKASVMNGDRIIYLSDKGKGIGLYTIRYIPLDSIKTN